MPNNRTNYRERGREDKEFDSKLLDLARVSHTRAGGRRMGFRAAVLAGDKRGRVGLGVATGKDVALAVEKATRFSKKHLVTVHIINDTIPHEVYAKYGAAKILLRPQSRGRGLVAGGVVRTVCDLVGIKNISSKILGRTGNKINNAKATLLAFGKLKTPVVKSKTKKLNDDANTPIKIKS